ncbi:hypothetical protein GCM10011490_19570 [Pseudoclavibacter endophyticus]|uniref:Uncharacterized protein n=1 Tax=Pseudoclavibacter endophyticus TaxID=1778590 RepID=A0A6H9WKJ1_9MICO|nr:hypothetical protein [Pseudoclavibacter endophyticus]KAB1648022.1 hypothetical protein F8O04_09815 [Pseudoclavibacter endophyticus]GGA69108.1 hypothetical protein GCM10011490_19570 [Pseudoclavibacter endophyticus]
MDIALDLTAHLHAAGVLDTVNATLDNLQTTIRAGVVVVAILLFLVVAARSRLRLAPTVLALVGAAAVIWLAAGGGLEWFAGLLGREFAA